MKEVRFTFEIVALTALAAIIFYALYMFQSYDVMVMPRTGRCECEYPLEVVWDGDTLEVVRSKRTWQHLRMLPVKGTNKD